MFFRSDFSFRSYVLRMYPEMREPCTGHTPGLQGLRSSSTPGSAAVTSQQPLGHTFSQEKMKPEEYDNIKEEVSNISVKNLATFWEDLSRQVQGELVRQESPSIRKKWYSMPELKAQVVKRKLPDATTQKKVRKIEEKKA